RTLRHDATQQDQTDKKEFEDEQWKKGERRQDKGETVRGRAENWNEKRAPFADVVIACARGKGAGWEKAACHHLVIQHALQVGEIGIERPAHVIEAAERVAAQEGVERFFFKRREVIVTQIGTFIGGCAKGIAFADAEEAALREVGNGSKDVLEVGMFIEQRADNARRGIVGRFG